MSIQELFSGRTIVIATRHAKERVIAPLLEKHLGLRALLPPDFDSDQFGTFTREIPRAGTQLEAARQKARQAMELTGVDLAVSSEGTFGAHPSIPWLQSNLELVLFVDRKQGYEIRGHHRTSETNVAGAEVRTAADAVAFARKIGFPESGIVLRESKNGPSGIHKNILTEDVLIRKAEEMLSHPHTQSIYIETDMRAHRNPLRMQAIRLATEDLIKNIFSLCPHCRAPGFVVTDFQKGLPCFCCHLPTDLPLYDIYACGKCGFNERRPVTKYGKAADPRYCHYCNP
jgi:hypothetical protein